MPAAEFDTIADAYDQTRRPLDEQTLGGITAMLEEYACSSILEIGVGTGRVSVPLRQSGYEITGIDVSIRMLERAKMKGLANLILGDGNMTPFRSKSFDATLMTHVFHILEDPLSVMQEAARVSEIGVLALIRKSSGSQPWPSFAWGGFEAPSNGKVDGAREERHERFRRIAEKYHWKWDRTGRLRNWGKEQEIVKTHPPDEIRVVSDVVVSMTLEDRITRIQKGAYGYLAAMPIEMRNEVIREMRREAQLHPEQAVQTRHEIYQVAMWRSEGLLRLISRAPQAT